MVDGFNGDPFAVPEDFPHSSQAAAISGFQPKLAVVQYDGRLYESGTTPPEIKAQWEMCEDLAQQFVQKCQTNEKGKYAHLTQEQILEQYCARLVATTWGTPAQMRWVIRRTAQILKWHLPPNVLEP